MRKALIVVTLMIGLGQVLRGDSTPLFDHLRFVYEGPEDPLQRRLLRASAAEFGTRSARFLDLVRSLRHRRHVLTSIQFAQLRLWDLGGLTRFQVARSGLIVAFIEMHVKLETLPGQRGATLAHEIAHVYEVACLPRASSTSALRDHLRDRADRRHRGALETSFPIAVEHAVVDEWLKGAGTPSQLRSLAARYGLEQCPSPGIEPQGVGTMEALTSKVA